MCEFPAATASTRCPSTSSASTISRPRRPFARQEGSSSTRPSSLWTTTKPTRPAGRSSTLSPSPTTVEPAETTWPSARRRCGRTARQCRPMAVQGGSPPCLTARRHACRTRSTPVGRALSLPFSRACAKYPAWTCQPKLSALAMLISAAVTHPFTRSLAKRACARCTSPRTMHSLPPMSIISAVQAS